MLNPRLNPGNRMMSKRDAVPATLGNMVYGDKDPKGIMFKGVSDRRVIAAKEQRPQRIVSPT